MHYINKRFASNRIWFRILPDIRKVSQQILIYKHVVIYTKKARCQVSTVLVMLHQLSTWINLTLQKVFDTLRRSQTRRRTTEKHTSSSIHIRITAQLSLICVGMCVSLLHALATFEPRPSGSVTLLHTQLGENWAIRRIRNEELGYFSVEWRFGLNILLGPESTLQLA